MAIQIDRSWPLVIVAPTKESALQKKSLAHLPPQDSQTSVISGDRIELGSDIQWEKGTFVDTYA